MEGLLSQDSGSTSSAARLADVWHPRLPVACQPTAPLNGRTQDSRARWQAFDRQHGKDIQRLARNSTTNGHRQTPRRQRAGQRGRANRRPATTRQRKPRDAEHLPLAGNEYGKQVQLDTNSTKAEIDQALDRELLNLYLASKEYEILGILYYAARWNWRLVNVDQPQSNAARLGYQARTRQQTLDPVTWEETLLNVYQLAELLPDQGETQLKRRSGLGFSMTFDAYRRSGNMAQVLREELRPRLGGVANQRPAWTLTVYSALARNAAILESKTRPCPSARRTLNGVS